MAVQGEGDDHVYATLLLSDTYLPGALVLAHSLRDALTTKKLAALVTLDTVSAEAITELKTVYHHVIPVPRIKNPQPGNLQLMNRNDLHSAFTKINLWKQTQFRKIVYIDADVVAYRAPDELFEIPHAFSAAPDIGWPDLFNTGVMVLTPSMGDYYAMMAMAERSISFDGADQGLINMHFKNSYNRISFTYNVTPSAHYQYVPAYRHFQSGINMVHFIGPDKPWFQGRNSSTGSSPFDEMTGRWWSVYDRHYRATDRASSPMLAPEATYTPSTTTTSIEPVPQLVQYLTKGEYQPKTTYFGPTSKPHSGDHRDHEHRPEQSSDSHSHHHGQQHHESSDRHHHEAHGQYDPQSGINVQQPEPPTSVSSDLSLSTGTQAEAHEEQIRGEARKPEQKPPPFEPSMSNWDAQRHPPPADSKPEAVNFPATVYEMSQDSAPFVAPERYPSPPKNMWYEVPKAPPAAPLQQPKAIFPWENSRPTPSRVFADPPSRKEEPEVGGVGTPTGEKSASPVPGPSTESSVTETFTVEEKSEPATPTTPTIRITSSDPWTSFTRTNAWDEVPEIERYVDAMHKHRRTRSLKSPGMIALPSPGEGVDEINWKRRGSKVTDFPSEQDRPSLPVTPAPIRRPKFWGGGGPGRGDTGDDPSLPTAEGVPAQSEWVCTHGKRWNSADCLCDLTNVLRYHKDPLAQLQVLAKQQSEMLLQKLGSGERDSSDLPPRPLPFGSEELVSPTYVTRSAQVLSPQPVKGSASSDAVRSIVTDPEATPRSSSQPGSTTGTAAATANPSSQGHGPTSKKGENYPTHGTQKLWSRD
ncbi:glycosyltransferase family 8 protein [Xylariaceae sp. FL0016]|nr:glycosyltransferase family 8 protein [Xylariaceae sp. FL0016]